MKPDKVKQKPELTAMFNSHHAHTKLLLTSSQSPTGSRCGHAHVPPETGETTGASRTRSTEAASVTMETISPT